MILPVGFPAGGTMVPIIIIVAVIALIALWFIASYNGFVRAKNDCEEGFSTMDVYLKKRFDLIPNLVETVKGYTKHESETLEKVVAARNMVGNATGLEERAEGETQLTGALKTLFAVAEAYPDLKANTNYVDLQNQLQTLEGEIAESRKYYNAVVKSYNNKCEMFPSSIIGNMFHFEKKPMFEVSSNEERENVKVDFN
jgi:LemA protein